MKKIKDCGVPCLLIELEERKLSLGSLKYPNHDTAKDPENIYDSLEEIFIPCAHRINSSKNSVSESIDD